MRDYPADIWSRTGINPIDLGAAGDGVSDDRAVFQSLLDAASLERGVNITIPPRKFRLRTPLHIHSKSITIDGRANGFSNSPNAEHESQTGSEISAEQDAFHIGNHNPQDIAAGCNKLGAINLRNLYLWGPGVYTGNKALYFDQHVDQSQLQNIHIGNFQWGVYSDTILDDPTLDGLDIIHCFEGFHFSEKSLAVYVKIQRCTFADNDGTGIFIHPASNSFNCQLTHCVLVRNARTEVQNGCNLYWGAREGIIANNIIQAAGYHFYNEAVLGKKKNHVKADGIIVDGSDNIITGNQILDHAMGAGIIIRGNRNQVIHNSFTGRVGSSRGEGSHVEETCKNQLDIKIEPGSKDTIIDQPEKFLLQDEGIRTIVNGMSNNAGDPEQTGDWQGRDKPDGLILHDTIDQVTWLYGQRFPKGRMKLGVSPADC